MLSSLSSTFDIVEICGGSARTSTMCVRKRLKVGKNFDLVTKSDLNDPYEQQLVVQNFIDHKLLVAVMSPQCPAFGSHANMNFHLTPAGLEHRCQTTANFVASWHCSKNATNGFFC